MTIQEQVSAFIEQHHLIEQGQTLVVGLSGGPDSVFLVHVLVELASLYETSLVAAHFDHGWRADSEADALFCKELAQSLGVAYVGGHACNEPAVEWTGSREEQGRLLRRAFLERVMREQNANAIALAHHQGDQLETFFIRLARGAGLTGLSAMRPRAGQFIRPLLGLSKAQILDYLQSRAIAYRTDPTNESSLYLRNRIRSLIIPALTKTDERFTDNCLRTIAHLQEADDYVMSVAHKTFSAIASYSGGRYVVELGAFKDLDRFLQKSVLLVWLCKENIPFTPSEAFFDEVLRFLDSPRGGKHALHALWSMIKKSNQAFVESVP